MKDTMTQEQKLKLLVDNSNFDKVHWYEEDYVIVEFIQDDEVFLLSYYYDNDFEEGDFEDIEGSKGWTEDLFQMCIDGKDYNEDSWKELKIF